MKLKKFALVVTVLFASIGITNAEHISNPPVSIQLSAKTTQLDRTQPLEVMPYMESKVTAETELSYAVMSVAKKHLMNKCCNIEMQKYVCMLILRNIIAK